MGTRSWRAEILSLLFIASAGAPSALGLVFSGETVLVAPPPIEGVSQYDPSLNLLIYSSPISGPSGAVFVGKNQALVTQKNDGKVLFFENGELSAKVLDLSVANRGTQGLVDIALSPKFSRDGFVYLYHTPAKKDGGLSDSKVISRYHWDKKNETLSFDRVISTVDKAPKASSLSGLISFDSKGRVSIAPLASAGPNVATAGFSLNNTTSTLRLFRPLDSLSGKSIVGLVPSYVINKAGGGTLSLLPQTTPFTSLSTQSSGSLSTTISASIPVKRGAAFASGQLNTLSLQNTPTFILGTVGSIQINNPILHPPIGLPTINLGNQAGGTLPLHPISPIYSGGALISGGTFNSAGTIVLNQDTLLTGGTITLGGQVSGSGAVNISGGVLQSPTTLPSGTITLSNGTIELPAATIDLSSGITQMTSGTLTLPGITDPSLIDPAPIGPALPAEPVVVTTSLGIINTPEPGILSLGIASFLGAMLRRRRRTQRIV